MPFEITISTCNGQFIGRKNIRSDTAKFCLVTNACCLKISGKYQNETIVKTYIVSNCMCQTVFASFNFSDITTPQPQVFNLIDENYGLPVENATLDFNSL